MKITVKQKKGVAPISEEFWRDSNEPNSDGDLAFSVIL